MLKKDGKPRTDANPYEFLNASCFEIYSDNAQKYIIGTEQGYILPLKKTKMAANAQPPIGKE